MKLKLDNFLSSKFRSSISLDGDKPSLWIFGYGSLIWNPSFEYESQMGARLPGYSRRFYQGNTTFRGTPSNPGRVVTLLQEEEEDTYGLAFKVQGWTQVYAALHHLYEREVKNGYLFEAINVKLSDTEETVPALTCIASKDNALFMDPPSVDHSMGDAHSRLDHSMDAGGLSMKLMALEIATAAGTAGPNHEYLTKLADCMRRFFPQIWDDHLFTLENYVIQFLKMDIQNGPSVYARREM